jgi:hypothetical protein
MCPPPQFLAPLSEQQKNIAILEHPGAPFVTIYLTVKDYFRHLFSGSSLVVTPAEGADTLLPFFV